MGLERDEDKGVELVKQRKREGNELRRKRYKK